MVAIYYPLEVTPRIYSFLATLDPFLAGRAFLDLQIAAALRRAALVRSFLYLCLTRAPFILCRDLPGPAFIVVATRDLPGLWASLALLVVTTNPLLSAAAETPTTLLFTSPLYLRAFLLVRLQASVEKGFLTPLFFRRKQLLSRITAQATSEETILELLLL